MSPIRQEALNWVRSKKIVVHSPVHSDFNDPSILPLAAATAKENIFGEKYILLHKGRLTKVPTTLWATLAGRSEVVFANSVFIIFRVQKVGENESNAIKSFYNYALEQLPESQGQSKRTDQAAGRFCHYVGNQTVLTETSFGRKIYLDSQDISLTPHIMYNGTWEPWITKLITNELKSGDVFVDIGANCGFFSLLGAHIVGPKGFVVAVEPQKSLASKLRRSIDINGFGRFASVAQVATGEESAQALLGQFEDYRGSASLVPKGTYDSEAELVEVKPLPDILDEIGKRFGRDLKPNFIKIDVEGYEYSAWLGMRELLRGGSPFKMILEFSPVQYIQFGQDPKAFVQEMIDLGFAVTWLHHDMKEEPFDVTSIERVIASGNYADLILRR